MNGGNSAIKMLNGNSGLNELNSIYNEKVLTKELFKRFDKVSELLQEISNNSQSSKRFYSNVNDNIITERQVLVSSLKRLLLKLEENYEDICERMQYLCKMKDNLKKLKNSVDKNTCKYYYRTCIILHDSIVHVKAERLTIKQLNAIKYLINKLDNVNLDKEEFCEIDDILVENDLEWIPTYEEDDEE